MSMQIKFISDIIAYLAAKKDFIKPTEESRKLVKRTKSFQKVPQKSPDFGVFNKTPVFKNEFSKQKLKNSIPKLPSLKTFRQKYQKEINIVQLPFDPPQVPSNNRIALFQTIQEINKKIDRNNSFVDKIVACSYNSERSAQVKDKKSRNDQSVTKEIIKNKKKNTKNLRKAEEKKENMQKIQKKIENFTSQVKLRKTDKIIDELEIVGWEKEKSFENF